jgi:hypothetical protein
MATGGSGAPNSSGVRRLKQSRKQAKISSGKKVLNKRKKKR